jgi:acyl-ACP thioesterase
MLPVWKEEFIIRSFDIDCQNQIKISNLCSYFQEIAGHHADHLGLGFHQIRRQGLVWVLSRLEISFLMLPKWGDTITIETWPAGNERLFYRREFTVKLYEQETIRASSFWLLINMETRRPKILPLPEEIEKQNAGKYATEAMSEDIAPVNEGKGIIIPVRYNDLDLNFHVNNIRYVGWLTDMFSVDYFINHIPEFLRIDFKHEVKAGESVEIIKKDTDGIFAFKGKISGTDTTCFKALMRFRKSQ